MEGLILKLKLQYFVYLMLTAKSLEKTLVLGKTDGKRRRVWQRMRWLDSIINSRDMSLSKLWDILKDRKSGKLQSMGSQRVEHDSATGLNCTWLPCHYSAFLTAPYVVQSPGRVRLFATPWTTVHQASLSLTSPKVYPSSCPLH